MRGQKGITLVALIITIVVLMILAGVAISAIQNNGILGYAENAATSWNQAVQNEAGTISGYEEYLANMGKCAHRWVNGKCTKCGITCKHNNETRYEYDMDQDDDRMHLKKTVEVCKICSKLTEGSSVSEACVIDGVTLERGDRMWECCDLCGADS